jgi:hypothetical protein
MTHFSCTSLAGLCYAPNFSAPSNERSHVCVGGKWFSYSGCCPGVFEFRVGIQALQHGVEASFRELVKVHRVNISCVDVLQDLGKNLNLVLLERMQTWEGEERRKTKKKACTRFVISGSSLKVARTGFQNPCMIEWAC